MYVRGNEDNKLVILYSILSYSIEFTTRVSYQKENLLLAENHKAVYIGIHLPDLN